MIRTCCGWRILIRISAHSHGRPIDENDADNYLPFICQNDLRETAYWHVARLSRTPYDPYRNSAITAGCTERFYNVLPDTVNQGDEMILPDPTFAVLITASDWLGAPPGYAVRCAVNRSAD